MVFSGLLAAGAAGAQGALAAEVQGRPAPAPPSRGGRFRRDRIDVHHHIVPPAFLAAMERHGVKEVAGAPLPHWTPEKSLDVMNLYGVQTALVSLSAPGVYFGDLPEAKSLSRACNEFAAEMSAAHPGRFGSFAVLPMPFTEAACAEAIHALDVLHADGVVLLGSTEGVFLGDPRFDELMAELNRRKAKVFVHPNLHPTSSQLDLQIPGYLVEFVCDTTRAATNLIFQGVLHRYPSITWILAHAGGFLPYIAWRLSLANDQPALASKAGEGVMGAIRKFYFDTALSPSPYAMAGLKELVGPSRILFGSDFPFAPAPAVGMEVKSLDGLRVLDGPAKSEINRTNALGLFPRLAAFSGAAHVSGAGRKLKRAVTKPIVNLADTLRKR
ncbi:amidohydrolase family protein [Caulobacter hibisci]|uniref:Amidohydrolase n=1 Tax=Caulobacter hibisci TaxID=2035993 RepID=A0ABS0SXH5_9CAUL|nr:amidohydrolase family protein [Caulobacter hibisci]MBI1684119.1 amidohydrolase [Caulobacter hibisci]